MNAMKQWWMKWGPEIRWLLGDAVALAALGLFLATLAIWAGLWTRVF